MSLMKTDFWHRAWHLYYDGFRSMTLGKTLWTVLLIKLFVIFGVLKFFFPDHIKQNAKEGHEAEYVASEVFSDRHFSNSQ